MAAVDQQADPAQRHPALEIAPDQIAPGLDLGLGFPGEAVARHVDQHQPLAEIEEIELLGAAGGVGDAGQGVATGQGVDQTGFPDVRAAGEGDLGQRGFGQLVEAGGAPDEAALGGEQQAAGLQILGDQQPVAEERNLAVFEGQVFTFTPMPRMISHC